MYGNGTYVSNLTNCNYIFVFYFSEKIFPTADAIYVNLSFIRLPTGIFI